jgi:hypothetical protein
MASIKCLRNRLIDHGPTFDEDCNYAEIFHAGVRYRRESQQIGVLNPHG